MFENGQGVILLLAALLGLIIGFVLLRAGSLLQSGYSGELDDEYTVSELTRRTNQSQ